MSVNECDSLVVEQETDIFLYNLFHENVEDGDL